MRQSTRNEADTTPFIIVDDERTRRINALIFPHKVRFDNGFILSPSSNTPKKFGSSSVIVRPNIASGLFTISLSKFVGTGVSTCYCIIPDETLSGSYLVITENDGVGALIPIVVITESAYLNLSGTIPTSAKISGNNYITMTGAFNTLTLVYSGVWRKVSGSLTAAAPETTPLLNLSVTVEVDPAQDILIGATYFDNIALANAGATSYKLKAIMAKTGDTGCPSGVLKVGLRDADGIITSAGSIISATVLQTLSSTITYISADVTATLSAATGPGILEALVIRDSSCPYAIYGRIDSFNLEVGF